MPAPRCAHLALERQRSMVAGTIDSRGTRVGTLAAAMVACPLSTSIGRDWPAASMPSPVRGIALRIEIDDQHVLADRRQRGAEIDGGGGLADAALLVGERQDARALERDHGGAGLVDAPAQRRAPRRYATCRIGQARVLARIEFPRFGCAASISASASRPFRNSPLVRRPEERAGQFEQIAASGASARARDHVRPKPASAFAKLFNPRGMDVHRRCRRAGDLGEERALLAGCFRRDACGSPVSRLGEWRRRARESLPRIRDPARVAPPAQGRAVGPNRQNAAARGSARLERRPDWWIFCQSGEEISVALQPVDCFT